MRKNALTKAMFAYALTFGSAGAFAQNYNGSVDDLNSVFNPPANIQGTICDHTDTDGIAHTGSVCRDGVAAARWMAEKYAKRAGKYLGCIDGYRQGISEGFAIGKNPTQDMTDEANGYVSQSQMDSALRRAEDRALKSGQTEAANDIISRYRSAVGASNAAGAQVLPNKAPTPPAVNFNGFSDGYATDIGNGSIQGPDFELLYREEYVKRDDAFQDKAAAMAAYNLQVGNEYRLCDVNDTIFGRNNMPQYTIWDFFRYDRMKDLQEYRWKDGSLAFSVFTNDEQNLDFYKNYVRIGEKTVTETVPVYSTSEEYVLVNGERVPELDANGQPRTNQYGDIIYKTETVRTLTGHEQVTRKVNEAEIARLRQEYKQAFENSYRMYFAKQYASIEYHQEGLDKYNTGKTVGTLIGREVALQLAKKEAYDARYKQISAAKFAEKLENLYVENFDRVIGIFENNPVVEVEEMIIDGADNDGIFRRGEEVSAQMTLTNLGEVARPVTVRLSNTNSVTPYQEGESVTPTPLMTSVFTSGPLGRISENARLHDTLQANLTVSNPQGIEEIASSLMVSASDGMLIRDMAEIKSVDTTFDVLSGNLDVTVVLANAATVETPSMPDVDVRLDGLSKHLKRTGLKIRGNSESAPLLLSFSGLDPIEVAKKGAITGKVFSSLGSKTIDQQTFTVRVSGSSDSIYSSYFDGLATGEITPTGKNVTKAIQEVTKEIEASLDSDLLRTKPRWNKQAEVQKTIIGKLQQNYNRSQAAGRLNAQAQAEYDKLAQLLAKRVLNKGPNRVRGGFLGISRKKNFLKQVQKISPQMSIKWKDHR